MFNHPLNSPISPLLAQKLGLNQPQANPAIAGNQAAPEVAQVQYNPLLTQAIIAQSSQILPAQQIAPVGTPASRSVEGYQNDLKKMLVNNEANILAVIPRTMNAQDKDGNELIQGDEISGNLVNAVERLADIKDSGFNTLHILPIHPTGKSHAMGTAGSLYAPALFVEKNGDLAIDPELVDEKVTGKAKEEIEKIYFEKTGRALTKMDKNDPDVRYAQFKYFINECHKKGIRTMLDLPSCASVDFAKAHPELMAMGPDGKEKVPQGWQDIRMFRPFVNEATRELNMPLLDMHKKYVDACIDLGLDGIRADVGRAKPVEFWDVIIKYSHAKDPNFGWLSESYTHEDASPQLNMPYDRPKELLEAGFDAYYGQYHIFSDWTKADQLYDYVKENIDLNNQIGSAKSLIGSFATHDDISPMLYGGAPWVMFTSTLQSMLPQVNFYMTDGVQTGDYYIFPYDHALVRDTQTDNHECTVHTGRMDIFNNSRKPGGDFPEINEVVKAALKLKEENKDVITKGSFIILPTNNPEIIAFARHKDGKTLLFIGNRNVNKKVGGTIQIPGLKPDQKLTNLMPSFGEESKVQNNKNGSINVELGTSRALIFEIDDNDIEKLSPAQNILQQKYLV